MPASSHDNLRAHPKLAKVIEFKPKHPSPSPEPKPPAFPASHPTKTPWVLLLCALLAGSLFFSPPPTPTPAAQTASAPQEIVITIHAGDTLWSIASRYASDTEDVRDVITKIRTANNLTKNDNLQTGDSLKIPLSTDTNHPAK